MGTKFTSNKRKGKSKQINSKNILENIKSKYILKQILENIHKVNQLRIFKYNKKTRNLLNIITNEYKTI